MSFNINFFEKFIAEIINEIIFRNIAERLKKEDLMADFFKKSDQNIKLGKRILDALNAGENIDGDKQPTF